MYLDSGRYTFDKSFNYLYIGADEKILDKLFGNEVKVLHYKFGFFKSIIELVFKVIFFKEVRVRETEVSNNINFKGKVFLPSRREKSFKIFDFENKKILFRFIDKEEYDNKIINYEYFKNIYPTPNIISKFEDELVIIEEFIEFKISNLWTEDDYNRVLDDFMDKTINYFLNIDKDAYSLQSIKDLVTKLPDNDILINYIWGNIDDKIKEMEFPFLKLQGDLLKNNVLIDNDGIKYIDFEHSGELIFYFDLINFIWMEFRHRKDTRFIENFIKGKYDNYMKTIFNLFDLDYMIEKKLDYINIFILVMYKQKDWRLIENEENQNFKLYKSFISYINKLDK